MKYNTTMKLKDYINQFPVGTRFNEIRRIAKYLKVSSSAVDHWYNGIRKIRPDMAHRIEGATNGQVTKFDMRPDIFDK